MMIEYQERPIDRQAAAFLCKGVNSSGDTELLRLVVSLACNAVGNGNICLDLAVVAGKTVRRAGKEDIRLPGLERLRALFQALPSVGAPGEHRPLVMDNAGRLYLYRYWHHEHELARLLMQRSQSAPAELDENMLQQGLDRMFPKVPGAGEDGQRMAASAALHRQFCVISGGPGTGKTSTVVRILALIFEQPGGLQHRVALAAPTGKAAARLKSSVNAMRCTLDTSAEVKVALPDEAMTIHRLLGTLYGSKRFRHSAANPLPFDTVIVDEASMVDLPLMRALVTAMTPGARLILLGDRNQLASVEAGAVLGDLCQAGEGATGSPLVGSVVELKRNYRFSKEAGIGELSRTINEGREREAFGLLQHSRAAGIIWQPSPARDLLAGELEPAVIEGYRYYLEAGTPAEALQRFDHFRLLCALREGPYGVSGLNHTVESILHAHALIDPATRWYRGRPVMVTANDSVLQLFNGDTGIIFPSPDNNGEPKVFFSAPDGTLRSLPPERLPIHETAFAMTVHKSQGSEFDRILLLLPPVDGDLLTRELLYTGITRAKTTAGIWANEEVFMAAVRRQTLRRSGLADALHQQLTTPP